MKLYYGTDGYDYKVLWRSKDLNRSIESVLLREMGMYDNCRQHFPKICFYEKINNKIYRYFACVSPERGEGRAKYNCQGYIDEVKDPADYLDNQFLHYLFEDAYKIQNNYHNHSFTEDVKLSAYERKTSLCESDLSSILYWLMDNLDNKKALQIIMPERSEYISYDERALNIIEEILEYLPANMKQAIGFSTYWNGDARISERIKVFITDRKERDGSWTSFMLENNEEYHSSTPEIREIVDQLINERQMRKQQYLEELAKAYFAIVNSKSNQHFTDQKALLIDCHSFVCSKIIPEDRLNKYFEYLMPDAKFQESSFYSLFLDYLNSFFDSASYMRRFCGKLNECSSFTDFGNHRIKPMFEALNIYKPNEFISWANQTIEMWFDEKIRANFNMLDIQSQDEKIDRLEEEWNQKKSQYPFFEEGIKQKLHDLKMTVLVNLEKDISKAIDEFENENDFELIEERIENAGDRVNYEKLEKKLNQRLERWIENQINQLTKSEGADIKRIQSLILKYESRIYKEMLCDKLDEKRNELRQLAEDQTIVIHSRKDLFQALSAISAFNSSYYLQIGDCIEEFKFEELSVLLQFLCYGKDGFNPDPKPLSGKMFKEVLRQKLLLPEHLSFAIKNADSDKKLRAEVLKYFLNNEKYTVTAEALNSAFSYEKSRHFAELKKDLCSKEMKDGITNPIYQDFLKKTFGIKDNIQIPIITMLVCCLLTVGIGMLGILTIKDKKELPIMLDLITNESVIEEYSSEDQKEIQSALNVLSQYSEQKMDGGKMTAIEALNQHLITAQKDSMQGLRMQRGLFIIVILFGINAIIGLTDSTKKRLKVEWMNLGTLLGSVIFVAIALLLL